MNCPETITLNTRLLIITRHGSRDWASSLTILRSERWNLLRYSICLFPGPRRIVINENGILERWRSDAWFYVKQFFRITFSSCDCSFYRDMHGKHHRDCPKSKF